ncbi:hypothetical protein ACIGB6_03475 [Paeniglutamicibacter gangotriensis]|uniref:hypothetical protein n=1 Tax=Paeniglutamicibacter gangotriensis TaxID=254787 RepID=UPI0037CC0419
MRALMRILGAAAAGFALFGLLGYLGMHFDWLNRGVRLNWAGLPLTAMLPRAAWEFGAAIALTVVLAACVVLFGVNGAQQAARIDPAYGDYPSLFARVLWHGASSAGSYAAIGVLGCVALLSRRPAPLLSDASAHYRRPPQ